MDTTKKTILAVLLTLLGILPIHAQEQYEMPPAPTEDVIGNVSGEESAGLSYSLYEYKESLFSGGWEYVKENDNRMSLSKNQLYEKCLSKARSQYGKTHPNLILRNFKYRNYEHSLPDHAYYFGQRRLKQVYRRERVYEYSAIVVVGNPKFIADQKLTEAINKSFRNIHQGARIAIDQVVVPSDVDREDYKDKLIDILLDKGYKIVAKEFLQKLYEEQQNQQSGIYNDRTTVQENNFSAVGYYVNVKRTETSIRIQIINVSTGEYESNATINL